MSDNDLTSIAMRSEGCDDSYYKFVIKLLLQDYANIGLRTLTLAVKDLSATEYEAWKEKHYQASIALTNRDDELHNVYEIIEVKSLDKSHMNVNCDLYDVVLAQRISVNSKISE